MYFRIIILSILICFTIAVTEDDFYSVKLFELGSKLIHTSRGFKTNWYGAVEFCKSLGLRLLTINSAEEAFLLGNFIKNFRPKIGTTWTSGNDLNEEGTWVWRSTGKTFQYSNWTRPQPDNKVFPGKCESENCLEVGYEFGTFRNLQYLYWNDAKCSNEKLFICEQPK